MHSTRRDWPASCYTVTATMNALVAGSFALDLRGEEAAKVTRPVVPAEGQDRGTPRARGRQAPPAWAPAAPPLTRLLPTCPSIAAVTPELEATLKRLPDRPGVYLMKDAAGDVLYVGKAQSLRHRVRSYWQKQAPAHRRGPPDPRGRRPDRRRRGDRGRQRQRGAAPRGEPHQAVQAALQRPAQGRQELPVHQGHARPTTSRASSGRASSSTTAAATSGRTRRRRASTSR